MRDGCVEAVRPVRHLERDGVPSGDLGRLFEGGMVAAGVCIRLNAWQLPNDLPVLAEFSLELRFKEVFGRQVDRALASAKPEGVGPMDVVEALAAATLEVEALVTLGTGVVGPLAAWSHVLPGTYSKKSSRKR